MDSPAGEELPGNRDNLADEKPGRILVRATVNLIGLPLGHTALVDPDDEYVARCLRGQALVPVDETEGVSDA